MRRDEVGASWEWEKEEGSAAVVGWMYECGEVGRVLDWSLGEVDRVERSSRVESDKEDKVARSGQIEVGKRPSGCGR